MLAGFEVRSFDRDQDTDELVTMWRASFEWGVGVTDPYPVQEQSAYLLGHVVPSHRVVVAHDDSGIVGFLASTDDSVGQLYVRVDRIGRGIGSRLLQLAKEQSSGYLWLYTFARNHRALAFYTGHGFAEVARGVEPTWQLEDVRMEWTRPGAPAGPVPPSRLRPTSSPAADAVAPEVESPASTPSPTSVATSSNGP